MQIPPGVPHAFALASDEPARFLDIHTPGFGAFLRGVRESFDVEPA